MTPELQLNLLHDSDFIPLAIEEVAERYANYKPGFRLVDFDYVGLPVYRLELEASFLDSQRISPIDQFVLRAVDAGLRTVEEIQGLLGIDARNVERSMVGLARSEDIALLAPEGETVQVLSLTQRGRVTVAGFIKVPTDHKIFIYYDGLLRKPISLGAETPMHPKELRDLGMREILPVRARPPSLDDLHLREVYEVLKTNNPGGRYPRVLLAIRELERRVRVYRRSIILIYRSLQGEDVQVTFAIDGRISADHEREFATNKGPSKMGILQSVLATPVDRLAKSFIGPGTAESSMKLSEAERLTEKAAFASATLAAVEKVAAAAASDKALKLAEERRIDAEAALAAAQAALKQPACRMIGVREHPQLLVAALTKSQKRLLIISPWIRGGVVDELFLRRIGQALDRGVKVYIGYGLGEPDREDRGPADIRAEKQLQRLANDNKNLLFKRFGNTHAKVLISDNAFCVATSFNWLSFRGDPNRTFREELGFLSNRAGDIEASFDLVIKRFQ